MNEEWKTFRNKKDKKHPYASKWEISNLGRVKRDDVIIEPEISDWGYKTLSFGCVHKFVAMMFLPRSNEDIELGRNEVDHIDGDRLNNNISNLRWCTRSENVSFPLARKHQYESAEKNGFKGGPPCKKVIQLDTKGNVVAEFNSVLEAGEKCHIWKGGISTVLKGKQKTAGGFCWRYKDEVNSCT